LKQKLQYGKIPDIIFGPVSLRLVSTRDAHMKEQIHKKKEKEKEKNTNPPLLTIFSNRLFLSSFFTNTPELFECTTDNYSLAI
jgi:hypothetical protein